MPKSSITWAGVSSLSLGLVVDQIPNMNRPERKVDIYNVPGRNGDIIVPQDAWENVEQVYVIWGHGSARNSATGIAYTIADWLFAPSGYQELSDTFDTTHFRKAYFMGPFDVENTLTRYGRAEITFNCDPRRFLNSGKTSITLTNGTRSYTNPTSFEARPVITVHGSGSGTITAYNKRITISSITEGMVIDCEAQEAYLGTANLNGDVSGEFPTLGPGTRPIAISGGITSIDMVPNWWTI